MTDVQVRKLEHERAALQRELRAIEESGASRAKADVSLHPRCCTSLAVGFQVVKRAA